MRTPRRLQDQSIFDRLQDYDVDLKDDPPCSVSEWVRQLNDQVRRDLEILLNSQRRLDIDDTLPALEASLLQYGAPGFHTMMLATKQQKQAFARSIKSLIDTFEPRLRNVKIDIVENQNPEARILRFKIRAQTQFEGAEGPIEFETFLDPKTRQFSLKNRRAL